MLHGVAKLYSSAKEQPDGNSGKNMRGYTMPHHFVTHGYNADDTGKSLHIRNQRKQNCNF